MGPVAANASGSACASMSDDGSDVCSNGACGTPMHIRVMAEIEGVGAPPPLPSHSGIVPTLHMNVTIDMTTGPTVTLTDVRASYSDTVCDVKKRLISLLPREQWIPVDTVSIGIQGGAGMDTSPQDSTGFREWVQSTSGPATLQQSIPLFMRCRKLSHSNAETALET